MARSPWKPGCTAYQARRPRRSSRVRGKRGHRPRIPRLLDAPSVRQTNKHGKTIPLTFEFIKAKSYHGTTSGELTLSLTEQDLQNFEGKNFNETFKMTFASAAQKAFQRVGIINIFVCGRRQSRTSSYLSCCCSYLYEIWISPQVKN